MTDREASILAEGNIVPFTFTAPDGKEKVIPYSEIASCITESRIFVTGKLKSGKSTLLQVLADQAKAGEREVCWFDLESSSDSKLIEDRVRKLIAQGFIGAVFFDGLNHLFPGTRKEVIKLIGEAEKGLIGARIFVSGTRSDEEVLIEFSRYQLGDWNLEQAGVYLQLLEDCYGEEVGDTITGMLSNAPDQLAEYYSRPYFLEKVYVAVARYRNFEDPAYLFRIGKEMDFAIIDEVKKYLSDKPVKVISGADTAYEIQKPVVTAGKKDLVITPYYPGLGDLLMLSHIPRIAKESGQYKRVLVTLADTYRDDLYRHFIWETNPYVDGYCRDRNTGCGTIEEKATDLSIEKSRELNFLDAMMLGYGLDDNRRFHEPELYYQATLIPELKDAVVYDPNFMTDSRIDQTDFFLVKQYFIDNSIIPDYQLFMLSDLSEKEGYRSIPITRFGEFLKASSFRDYVNIIYSARRIYCLTTGTATLAAAMGKGASILLGQNTTWCHHSRTNRHIDLRPYGGSLIGS
ncbi:MAG: hypothetical protein WBB45_09315 [Cyclobacteriaceae bacterium]